MNVKTYRTKSLQEALDNIKRDLGSEALVLSTREVVASRPFGFLRKPKWEVAAAARPETATAAGSAPAQAPAPAPATAAAVATAPAPLKMPKPAEPKDMDDMPVTTRRNPVNDRRIDLLLEEMDEVKRSLKTIGKSMPARPSGPSGDAQGGGVYHELVNQGIDSEMAESLIQSASRGNPSPGELRSRVRRLLGDMIVVDPPAELHAKGRVVSVFVGPTGVGKTTTIAKIAGQATTRFKKNVALITTDMMRVGGQDQLTRYGALLGVPAYTCSEVSTLKDLIESLDDCDLILVDTPGASPSDLARLSKLEAVMALPEARMNLVISATTRSEDISKIVNRFQRFSPKRVVFTKIDETDSRSLIVGDLLRNEVAISYITNGQRVPDDLLVPVTAEMTKWVLPDA
jgi:flagellar biosynthesis protein FlhF